MSNRYSFLMRLLFPVAHGFRLFIITLVRKLIDGLSPLPEDVRKDTELVYLDLFPDTTRSVDLWKEQFGITFYDSFLRTSVVSVLKSLWIGTTGGQSISYLDQILKQINSKINIVENIPLKNPRDSNSAVQSVCGHRTMVCGNREAVCSYRIGDISFTPTVIINDSEQLYDIPNDPKFWSTCVYICGNVTRNSRREILYISKVLVDKSWKDYIEYIMLKIKPAHITMVLYIEYV